MYPNNSVFDGVNLPVLCWGQGYLDSSGVIQPGDDPMQGGGTYLKYAKITDTGEIEYKHSAIVFRDGSRRVTPIGWRPSWIFDWNIYRTIEYELDAGDIVDSHRQLRIIVQKWIDTNCTLTLYPQGNPDYGYVVTIEDFSPGFLKKTLASHNLKMEFKAVDFYDIPTEIKADQNVIDNNLVPGYFNTDGTMGFGFSVFHNPITPPSAYLAFLSFATGSITANEQGSLGLTWTKDGTDPGEHNDVANYEGTGRADQCYRNGNLWHQDNPPAGLEGDSDGIFWAIKVKTSDPIGYGKWYHKWLATTYLPGNDTSYVYRISAHHYAPYDTIAVYINTNSGSKTLYSSYHFSAATYYYVICRYLRTGTLELRIYDINQTLLSEEVATGAPTAIPKTIVKIYTGYDSSSVAPGTAYQIIDNIAIGLLGITDIQIMKSMENY